MCYVKSLCELGRVVQTGVRTWITATQGAPIDIDVLVSLLIATPCRRCNAVSITPPFCRYRNASNTNKEWVWNPCFDAMPWVLHTLYRKGVVVLALCRWHDVGTSDGSRVRVVVYRCIPTRLRLHALRTCPSEHTSTWVTPIWARVFEAYLGYVFLSVLYVLSKPLIQFTISPFGFNPLNISHETTKIWVRDFATSIHII